MAPELRHLRHFVAVAEELNFTRAAGRLFLAQQALSSSIKQLENELGQPLFVRDTRRVALTPAGETLLPRARRLLAMAEETVTAVRHGTPDRAVLRVDISSSNLETGALVLRRLREDRPEIEVRQREIGVPSGLVALREDELDVLLGDAAAASDGVAVEPLRQETVQVMLAADHPCAAQPAVPVAALADEVWLLPPDDAAPEWNQLVLRHCQEAGFRPRRYPGTTWGPAAAPSWPSSAVRGADQRLAHRAGRGGVPTVGRPGDPVPVVGDVGRRRRASRWTRSWPRPAPSAGSAGGHSRPPSPTAATAAPSSGRAVPTAAPRCSASTVGGP